MMIQGSDEWKTARLGKVTASRVADILAKTKSGYSTSRQNYAIELALERITGRWQESFTSAAMQRGTEQEPIARAVYESRTGNLVEEVGLINHPRLPMCAASPDGLIDDDGMLEIKNPNSATHLKTLLSGKADPQYLPQMYWQMACSGRKWVDFVSFDNRMPSHAKFFMVRVPRDDKVIAEIEAEVAQFLTEVGDMVMKISSYKETA